MKLFTKIPNANTRVTNDKLLDSPYAGLLLAGQDANNDSLNAGRVAGQAVIAGPHILLTGLTGAGKGRRVIMPAIIRWGDRPVIASSAKADLLEATIKKRAARGPVYVLDLCDEVQESDLHGIDAQRVVSDPCALVNSDDEAMQMADLLQATGTMGGDGSSNSDPLWQVLASRPLAAFIRAGGWLPDPETGEPYWGGGINWVISALDHFPKKGLDELSEAEQDLVTPNWSNAYLRASALLNSRHAETMRATMNKDPKQRDSIAINISTAVNPWTLSAVSGDGTAPPFQPHMLETPGATLYMVTPLDGSAAGAGCAVVEQTIKHWRQGLARKLPTLGLFLDELANCLPLPKLPSHVSLLRGYNVRMLVGLQTTTQLKKSHGEAGYEEMIKTFPSILVMPGTPEKELLEQAAWFAGEDERITSSTDQHNNTSRSSELLARVTSSELLPRKKGEGRLLLGGQPGMLVNLPDISATDLLD